MLNHFWSSSVKVTKIVSSLNKLLRHRVTEYFQIKSARMSLDINVIPLLNGNVDDVEVLMCPDKSESDPKEYRMIKLSNGLQALLISDPRPKPVSESDSSSEDSTDAETASSEESSSSEEGSEGGSGDDDDSDDEDNSEKLAAAALMVDVGSFSDLKDIQGIAHFLEHMIFMGSKKFPKENEFDSYIKKCGGSDNADTDCEETSFYFEVGEEHLDGALDRFSQLFVEPLLKRDAMTREREAVESEFALKMNADDVRRDQLIAELAHDNEPAKTFTWGNMITLKERVSDDYLYEQVQDFRRRHYSANRMYAAIQARLPLDDLQDMIVKHFSQIPNNNLPRPDFSQHNYRNIFTDSFQNKVYYVKPYANIIKLEITWCLPSLLNEYLCKPHHFVSFLLSHEGRGSLCSYLRKKFWAFDVSTSIDDSGFEFNSMYSLFAFHIHLTDKGFAEIDDVLDATFTYIRLLNSENLEERFKELQQIEATTFRFMSEQDPIDYVEDVVINLKYYSPKHALTGPHLYYEYDEVAVKKFVAHLSERTFNVMLLNKEISGAVFDQKEQWFGTEYFTKDFPQKWVDLWNSTATNAELYFPEKNNFISTDFTILPPPENLTVYPEKILSTNGCELWYKQDTKFLRPKAFMYFYFYSPLPGKSVKNATLLNMYGLILKYYLVDDLYNADVAGLTYIVYSAENGIVLKASGYNEKLHLVVEFVTRAIKLFMDTVTPENFETFKSKLRKDLYNAVIKPKALNKDIRLNIIQHRYHTYYDRFNILQTLTLDELMEFGKEFLQELKVIAIIQGNVTKEHALSVMRNVLVEIPCDSEFDKVLLNRRANQVPLGQHCIRIRTANPKDVNTAITNFYQVGPSTIKLTAKLDLLMMLIEEPLFDALRTKEQLGYDIGCSVRDNFSILGFTISVNSQETKFHAVDVEQRIEKFRRDFLDDLKVMPASEFNQVKESLIKLNLVADQKLRDEVQRNWAEITTEEFIFDRREKEVEALQNLTQEEFLEFYENLVDDSQYIRKLSVQVIGDSALKEIENILENNVVEEMETMPDVYSPEYVNGLNNDLHNISSLEIFRDSLFTYPWTKTQL